MWPLVHVVIARFRYKTEVSEVRREKIFEKNISKYLNIFVS